MLKAAGLTTGEETAYLMLVRRGSASLPQIARRLGLSESRARRIVAGLQGKGLVHQTPPPRERVVAVPPEIGVEQLVRRREQDLRQVLASAQLLAAEATARAGARRTARRGRTARSELKQSRRETAAANQDRDDLAQARQRETADADADADHREGSPS